jgi:hypothetical protein
MNQFPRTPVFADKLKLGFRNTALKQRLTATQQQRFSIVQRSAAVAIFSSNHDDRTR